MNLFFYRWAENGAASDDNNINDISVSVEYAMISSNISTQFW